MPNFVVDSRVVGTQTPSELAMEISMKKLTALAGIAFLAVATPAAAYTNPPDGHPTGNRGDGPTEVPAPPVALIFALAAGAIMARKRLA